MALPYKLQLKFNYLTSSLFSHCIKQNGSISCSYRKQVDITRDNFQSFELMVENRRNEAKKSIIIEAKDKNLQTLHSVCSQFGNIKRSFTFKPPNWSNMFILEFEEEASIGELLREARINTGGGRYIHLPFLKFLEEKNSPVVESQTDIQHIEHTPFEDSVSNNDVYQYLFYNCNSVSEQMQYFYDTQKITEIGWRLRFLTCRKIELALPCVLSHGRVLPFGSSVNTFGNRNCDLDMIIDFNGEKSEHPNGFPLIQPGPENSSRGRVQENLRVLATLLSSYLPGVENVLRILQARVPIVKCYDSITNLECDISLNSDGFQMSKILYIYGSSDSRVRPLVFCIRWWAKQNLLTRKDEPGHWFSGFMLTFLVIYFLMNTKPAAVVPPLLLLQKLSVKKSNHSNSLPFSHIQNLSMVPISTNTQSLERLMMEFFEFYSTFDFKKEGISLVTGKTFMKPDFSAMYLENPCERELNVTKNIRREEASVFQSKCAIACGIRNIQKSEDSPWGVLALCTNSIPPSPPPKKKKKTSFMYDSVDIASLISGIQEEEKTAQYSEGSLNNPSPEFWSPHSNSSIPKQKPIQKEKGKKHKAKLAPRFRF